MHRTALILLFYVCEKLLYFIRSHFIIIRSIGTAFSSMLEI